MAPALPTYKGGDFNNGCVQMHRVDIVNISRSHCLYQIDGGEYNQQDIDAHFGYVQEAPGDVPVLAIADVEDLHQRE